MAEARKAQSQPGTPPRRGSLQPEGEPRCDICGAGMEALHCRLFCRNCGYMLDCSDP